MPELDIRHVGATELHQHFDREFTAQGCYVELGLKDGVLLADYHAEVGSPMTPFSVHYGFDRRWAIPALTGEAANALLRDIAPLAQRMLDDWETDLDDRQANVVAVLGDDAAAAEREIADLIGERYPEDLPADMNPDLIQEWDLDSATNGEEADAYDITDETTDERLAEIEADILSNLAMCGSIENPKIVCHGLDSYLEGLREQKIAEAREKVEDELEAIAEAVASRPDTVKRAARLGLSDRRIAELLNVSHVTVGNIRKNSPN
ncbi:hypothetical protein OHA84_37970 (plasmid) [Streptomyces sp. NBC_00513]|uniref:hypothetical protein n=1 Tax=unclassified Streptomyces TaxID=2593676 RepID=UPI00225C2AE6|nr:hypothetical protein [Streptomyces sp. NBC_00424]MCX5078760.1 hypothetical protein [Streptomyces sp. NBC_00424]WUD46318.1 hypothetical protein OHA84_37970 [Streptomyces sp. NBC_00513]